MKELLKMGDAGYQEIVALSAKLDVIIALMLQRSADLESKQDKGDVAEFLRGFGLSYPSIALILGSSANSIKVLLSQKRAKGRKGNKRK